MDEHCLLDISGSTLCFPVYDVEALWTELVACRTAMVDGRRSLKVFLNPFSQCPAKFTYVVIWTIDVTTLEMVDDSTFVKFMVLVFGCSQLCFWSASAL